MSQGLMWCIHLTGRSLDILLWWGCLADCSCASRGMLMESEDSFVCVTGLLWLWWWMPTHLLNFHTSNTQQRPTNTEHIGECWTCETDKEWVRERKKKRVSTYWLFIVQGGFKSTCSGTRARTHGFITAGQIITAQIPDTDHSSSASLSFTSFCPFLYLSPLF